MESTKADNWIGEEHLLNFVVNSLNEELPINLGEDIEISTEDLYEVLAGASASGTSVNHICETTEDFPHANTVQSITWRTSQIPPVDVNLRLRWLANLRQDRGCEFYL